MTWWLSRVCEEFGCLPSAAWRELRQAPAGLIEDICEMRAYAKAWRAYEDAGHMDDGPMRRRIMNDPLVLDVRRIEADLVRGEVDGDG